MVRSCHLVLWRSSSLLQGASHASVPLCMEPHQLHRHIGHCQTWVLSLCNPLYLPNPDVAGLGCMFRLRFSAWV
jgi:hypothetical protein